VAGGALSANARRELPWGEHPYQRFLADPVWDSPVFVERYGGLFQSNYIAELLYRLAWLEPTEHELQHIELPWVEPPFAVPPVLIHCTTTRAAKIWPFERWAAEYHAGAGEDQLLAEFSEAAGGPLIDLRGQTSLIELAGACRAARAVVSVDAGPLHIAAAAVGTPVLAVVGNDSTDLGASPLRLWLPRAPQLQRTVSTQSCDGCETRRYRNDACIAVSHHCMEGVGPHQVIDWLEAQLVMAQTPP
jgi:heptosyltransferase-3